MLFVQNKACNTRKYVLALSLFASSMGIGSTAAVAADASGNYQQERAACLSGQTQQDKKTCLREAGAARSEAKRGKLNGDASSYQQNAQARCNALPPADRDDCMRRMQGEGTVSGSVDGGGIYRETTTIVPAPMPSGSEYRPAPVPAPQY
ncbi:hypothetical protein [Herminiimonas fonticola]|uniref:PsiF repeat-containing protein n=1 Tax=Herminiimonas fonticola TaxID=303380 RepID=A0A4V3BWD8_9BURK|nr:hypothetical protein [Herminiimonas fonticola]RBA24993.1 hypothetical protein Hfont_0626 [Herminiimonas fonticola]TDN94108.1 hypothetical protein EV677_0649 [Herminiimonas fonticola]